MSLHARTESHRNITQQPLLRRCAKSCKLENSELNFESSQHATTAIHVNTTNVCTDPYGTVLLAHPHPCGKDVWSQRFFANILGINVNKAHVQIIRNRNLSVFAAWWHYLRFGIAFFELSFFGWGKTFLVVSCLARLVFCFNPPSKREPQNSPFCPSVLGRNKTLCSRRKF